MAILQNFRLINKMKRFCKYRTAGYVHVKRVKFSLKNRATAFEIPSDILQIAQ